MTRALRRIVLILGMHRSGTSLLARLLAADGLPLGRHLLDRPAPDNAHGYWEQAEIVAVQEALLDHFDRRWHGPNGARPLPQGWLETDAAQAAKARLAAIADREIRAAGGLWGFKDPRSLRLLPLWRAIIAEQALAPVFILAARDPAAVVGSLMQRNRMRRGLAEAVWARHMLDAVSGAGAELSAVIDYDSWFTAPGETARHLRAILGLPGTGAADGISARVERRLRHQDGQAIPIHPAFQALHAALIAQAPRAPPPATLQGPAAAAAAALAMTRKPHPILQQLRKPFGLYLL